MIASGSCYVWEEHGQHSELTGNALAISRWTDGIRWGPSRVRDGFLFYQEKRDRSAYAGHSMSPSKQEQSVLNKQTYTVFVDTARGKQKWHLIAYFTQESLPRLKVIEDFPELASLQVPLGSYPSARHPKGRPEHVFTPREGTADFVPYLPSTSGSPSTSQSSQPYARQPRSFIMWPTEATSSPRSPADQRYGDIDGSDRSESSTNDDPSLAPLTYLQSVPPPRRHPIDEKTLMRLGYRP